MTGTPLWACWLAAGLSAGVLIGVVWLSARRTARLADALADWVGQVASGDLAHEVPLDRSRQLGELSHALTELADRLRESVEAQHQLEEEHRAELEQRERLSETMIRTGHVAASATEQHVLLDGVAEELATVWPRYCVGLYLLAGDGVSAVLGAEAGMQDAGLSPCRQRVAVGDGTTVGQCLATDKVLAWPETGEQASHFERVFQAGARSELAVPLRSRGHVLGAISVYSDRLETFARGFVAVLENTGDQLACALERLRLGQAMQEAGWGGSETSTAQAWRELLRTRGSWGYRYADGQVESAGEEWPAEMTEALRRGRLVPANPISQAEAETAQGGILAIPVKVRDQVVGVLGFRKAEETATWTQRETRVLELVVAELGDALMAAQLYEDAQSTAVRQQIVGELSSRMRQTLDVEAVLRTAAAEVRQALGLSEVVVRLQVPTAADDDASASFADEARA